MHKRVTASRSTFLRSAASRSWIRCAHPWQWPSVALVLSRLCVVPLAQAQNIPPGTPAALPDTIRLSLEDVRVRALASNPELLAARLDTAIARGLVRQAGVLAFNPSADALTGGDALEVGLSQEIEVFGQRGVRLRAERAGLDRARASAVNAARLTIGAVDRSFYRLAAATQRMTLAREVLALNERLADVARRQLAEGEISRLDFNLAIVELGRARARELATRREQQEATIELSQLAGLPIGIALLPEVEDATRPLAPDTLGGPPGDVRAPRDTALLLDVEALLALARDRRPDLQAHVAAVRQMRAQAALSRREALPNLIARGVLEQSSDGGRSILRPGLGLSLPILNRNQGQIQALRAAALQAELERAALVTRVRAEVTTAVAAYRAATTEVAVLESTVLAPARQNRRLVEIAYREGKVGLAELLLIQNQAIDAELDYWEAWLAARQARSTLAEATGRNIDTIP